MLDKKKYIWKVYGPKPWDNDFPGRSLISSREIRVGVNIWNNQM